VNARLPIVVFGAAGALGRRVLALLPGDREVIAVDRVLRPACDLAEPADLRELATRLPRRLIAINVTGDVSATVDPESVAASVRNNVQSTGVIVSGLGDRLEHFVHLSSISVYGPPDGNPITEDHPLRPDSVYGIAKSAGEQLVTTLCASLDRPLTVIRPTQLFALPSADDAFPHALARRLRGGETPHLTVDPATRRDYLHVDDAAQLIVRAALAPRAGVFNAGSGGGVLLGELVAVAYEAAGRTPEPGAGRDTSQWLDIRAAQEAFDWTPVQSILDWIRVAVVAGGLEA
jgi:nucleoside-diphosphate-sugar epimerase